MTPCPHCKTTGTYHAKSCPSWRSVTGRSLVDYQSIVEELGFTMIKTQDLVWIDEHIKE